jgi:threonine/homoserine/homoserine lactone efflux protein
MIKGRFKLALTAFVISFLGSLPVGVLNVFATQIYMSGTFTGTLTFIGGVLIIEALVIAITLRCAQWIQQHKSWLKIVKIISLLFLVFLAGWYWYSPQAAAGISESDMMSFGILSLLTTGLLSGLLNIVQIPFWTGWNLVLINSGTLKKKAQNSEQLLFIASAITGTFIAMLCFIFATTLLTEWFTLSTTFLFQRILPVTLLLVAIWQLRSFFTEAKIKYH